MPTGGSVLCGQGSVVIRSVHETRWRSYISIARSCPTPFWLSSILATKRIRHSSISSTRWAGSLRLCFSFKFYVWYAFQGQVPVDTLMVAFNISVDDSSPLLTYTGLWLDTPANDTLAVNYTSSSLHTTFVPGAQISLTFNGTGVWFYGGTRPNYGSYALTIDGISYGSGLATSLQPLFDQYLKGASNLTMGEHKAVLFSAGEGPMDIDYVIFETDLGGNGTQVSTMTLDDTAANITYSPSTLAWNSASHDFFGNGSVHFTQSPGAQASLSFNGDAIAVYGGVSFDHGNYTVTLDEQNQAFAGGNARTYHAQSLLYYAQGLGPGDHTLTITANDGFFDLDYIQVQSVLTGNNASSGAGTPAITAAPASPSTASEGMEMGNSGDNFHINQSDNSTGGHPDALSAAATSKPISKPVIVGIIIASVIGLLTMILLIVFIVSRIRQRRRNLRQAAESAISPILPIQAPDLEAGGGGIVLTEKANQADNLARSVSKATTRSAASRWSQDSYVLDSNDASIPPVPPLTLPLRLNTPVLPQLEKTSSWSVPDISRSPVVSDDDSDSRLGDDDRSSVAGSVAPLRPARPPTLDLKGIDPDFEHVPL